MINEQSNMAMEKRLKDLTEACESFASAYSCKACSKVTPCDDLSITRPCGHNICSSCCKNISSSHIMNAFSSCPCCGLLVEKINKPAYDATKLLQFMKRYQQQLQSSFNMIGSSHPITNDSSLEIIPRNDMGGRMTFGNFTKRHRKRNAVESSLPMKSDDSSRRIHIGKKQSALSSRSSFALSIFDFHSQSSQPTPSHQTHRFESPQNEKDCDCVLQNTNVESISGPMQHNEAPRLLEYPSHDAETRMELQYASADPILLPTTIKSSSTPTSTKKQNDLGLNTLSTDVESVHLNEPLTSDDDVQIDNQVEATIIMESPYHDASRSQALAYSSTDSSIRNKTSCPTIGEESVIGTTESTEIEIAKVIINSQKIDTSQPVQDVNSYPIESPSQYYIQSSFSKPCFESSSSESFFSKSPNVLEHRERHSLKPCPTMIETSSTKVDPFYTMQKGVYEENGRNSSFVTPGSSTLHKQLSQPSTILPMIHVDILDSQEMVALQKLWGDNLCLPYSESSHDSNSVHILVTHAETLNLFPNRPTHICLKTGKYDQGRNDGKVIVHGKWLIESVERKQLQPASSFEVDGDFTYDTDSSNYTIRLSRRSIDVPR